MNQVPIILKNGIFQAEIALCAAAQSAKFITLWAFVGIGATASFVALGVPAVSEMFSEHYFLLTATLLLFTQLGGWVACGFLASRLGSTARLSAGKARRQANIAGALDMQERADDRNAEYR